MNLANHPYQKSIELLKQSLSRDGFLASSAKVTNYNRVWSRDGVICGLAALLSGDDVLIEGLRRTLLTLANHQSPQGHIPSNVQASDKGEDQVSYGGMCGRADTGSWFIIGVCNYAELARDLSFAKKLLPQMLQCLDLMQAWEYNNRGLMYVPQSGDWADEYILHGYVLYDQVLRLWAMQCVQLLFPEQHLEQRIRDLIQVIELNYYLEDANNENPGLYHRIAYQNALDKHIECPYWLSSFYPGGYTHQFDLFANSLCLLLDLGTTSQRKKTIDFAADLRKPLKMSLLPAFYPPVFPGDPEWKDLSNNYKYDFRNYPYEFHNGGTWPMINGFFGAALIKQGQSQQAEQILDAMHVINQKNIDESDEWGFYENFHTKDGYPLGTQFCAWSAAGSVILHQYLSNKKLLCT